MEFHMTPAGNAFYNKDVPALIKAISKLADEHKRANDNQEKMMEQMQAMQAGMQPDGTANPKG